jgi:hypothetical protein
MHTLQKRQVCVCARARACVVCDGLRQKISSFLDSQRSSSTFWPCLNTAHTTHDCTFVIFLCVHRMYNRDVGMLEAELCFGC